MIDGKLVCLQAEDPNEDISIALLILGTIIYLRALQGHSGGNLIDLTLQDNVIIQRVVPIVSQHEHACFTRTLQVCLSLHCNSLVTRTELPT